MTTIRFFRDRDTLSGFLSEGHSGYAAAGEDIVCAAITSAIRLCECTINDVMGAKAETVLEDARISLSLPVACPQAAADVLQGLFLYLRELQEEYPNYLTVLEV